MDELNLAQFMSDFHWQRPYWLLGIAAAILTALYLLRGNAQNNSWKQVINPELLPHLLQGAISRQQKWPLLALALAISIASLAMAGPSWEKLPQPIHKTESALVVLLDLSPSMMAQDIKPSRLVRARLKLIDLLKYRQEGLSALIAYAGEAYTVTPLTDDTETIISLLPSLSPGVMPLGGSNTEMAIDQALTLFKDAGLMQGEILLVTDGVTDDAIDTIDDQLSTNFRLSILGVGSAEGAPIPIQNGGFAKDRSGAIVLAKLNTGELSTLANHNRGRYRTLSNSDSDISDLVSQPELMSERTRQLEREFDTWIDRGAWLCLLLIPFAALSFRKGWLLTLPLLLLAQPEKSYALDWQDAWQTKDQQAQKLLHDDKAAQAAETFKRQDWKAAAQYRAGDFEAAAQAYASDNSAAGRYNLGNALTKNGKLEDAIKAYEEALERDPDFEDATNNKSIVEELLKQQQEQQQNSEENSDEGSEQNQDSSQSKNGDQQSSDQSGQNQNSDQDSSDSQDSDQASENTDQNQSDEESQNQQSQDQSAQDGESSESQQDQQQPGQQSSAEQPQENSEMSGQAAEQTELSDEEQQAMEQWLRKIPDDPSGLMRKKFEHQYRQRRKEYQQGTWQPPANEANKRW